MCVTEVQYNEQLFLNIVGVFMSPRDYSQRMNLLFSGHVFWLFTLRRAPLEESGRECSCLCLRSSLLGHKMHEGSTSQNDGKWLSQEIELIYIPLTPLIRLSGICYFPLQRNTYACLLLMLNIIVCVFLTDMWEFFIYSGY